MVHGFMLKFGYSCSTFAVNGSTRWRAREEKRMIYGGIALNLFLFFFPSFFTPIVSKLCHLHHHQRRTLHHTWHSQHHLQGCSVASPDWGPLHSGALTLLRRVRFQWWRSTSGWWQCRGRRGIWEPQRWTGPWLLSTCGGIVRWPLVLCLMEIKNYIIHHHNAMCASDKSFRPRHKMSGMRWHQKWRWEGNEVKVHILSHFFLSKCFFFFKIKAIYLQPNDKICTFWCSSLHFSCFSNIFMHNEMRDKHCLTVILNH